MNEALLNRKAINRILVVLTAGVLLLLFDFFIGFDFASLQLLSSDKGSYLIRPAAGDPAGHIDLRADIRTADGTVTKKYNLTLDPYAVERPGGASGAAGGSGAAAGASGSGAGAGSFSSAAEAMSEEEILSYEMRNVISALNDDQSVRRVTLPGKLRTGETVTWTAERRSNTAVIALGMILLSVIIYLRRLDPIEKIRRSQMASVRRQLPEFLNRLVLLLGAGLVLSSAFARIVEESRRTEALAGDYFYGCMAGINDKIRETNGSMEKEFQAFARSSICSDEGSRELMRISNIISDNISKGVELTDKLRSESEALWLDRKRQSEERGRLAETKLTMPLTVFLLVLVVITVSPALLEL